MAGAAHPPCPNYILEVKELKKLSIFFIAILLLALSACGVSAKKPLPSAQPDSESMFGVDKNINIDSIDAWLGRDDVVYRDMRMLFDPADYEAIGGESDLTQTIEGFKIVPYPYIASMSELPVSGAYSGNCLFSVEWGSDGSVSNVKANYEESMMILEELFPKDKAIFLMCGGGGYSGMMRSLLIKLGWDETKIYNVGANWSYTGEHSLELVVYPEAADGKMIYATWRADYAYIDFTRLQAIGE